MPRAKLRDEFIIIFSARLGRVKRRPFSLQSRFEKATRFGAAFRANEPPSGCLSIKFRRPLPLRLSRFDCAGELRRPLLIGNCEPKTTNRSPG